MKQKTDGDEVQEDLKRDERYVRKADDVKPQNGLFEPKASCPFCGFAFNQLPDPLVFLRLWSGA